MARNNEAKKYYLSPAAVARLRAESERTTYSMSVVLDQLIMKHVPPVAVPLVVAGAHAVRPAIDLAEGDSREATRHIEVPVPPQANPSIAKPEDASTAKERFNIDL